MTKVLDSRRIACFAAVCIPLLIHPLARAADNPSSKPAETLYMQLTQVGLDPARVYKVRDAALDRPAIHIALEDGTIAFTQDVMGKITGAFFQGDGEILLTPPDEVERRSMSLFTGMAILEERFATAYFRFNDDVPGELRPDLRQADDKSELVDHFGSTAKNLASSDGMRMLSAFSRMLPVRGAPESATNKPSPPPDRFLHVRLQGIKLGVFDVYFDSAASESVMAGQATPGEGGGTYYNVWTSFAPQQARTSEKKITDAEPESDKPPGGRFVVQGYKIVTDVLPPTQIHAKAVLQCEAQEAGIRTLFFELSRSLKIEALKLNGEDVESIHNPALEGTELARRGNDLVAVVLPAPTRAGQIFQLEFTYGGEVLAEAGSGLLYVGARGTWYPNLGLQMTNFDLEFHYPSEWTLVATGKPSKVAVKDNESPSGEQSSRWVSDRPIPLAGFNLGKYEEVTTRAGDVTVLTYATKGVERDFPTAPIQVIQPARPTEPTALPPRVFVPSRPSPNRQEVVVGEAAAQAIEYFSQRFGPFPYTQLALTQMPGRESQGWPGLIFLSSYAFLDDQQREQLHFDQYRILLQKSVPAHETAHQWWGDLVGWSSYRDQWFSEGLANYCALMMLLDKNPAGFREVMNAYRRAMVEKTKDGSAPMDAGPVTLGSRLLSSKFPGAYDSINYGRGTWLFHMLRTMLKDAAEKNPGRQRRDGEEPFTVALRKVRQRYEGKTVSTRELIDIFAEDLPSSLRYEGKKSLDWFLEGWVNGTSVPKLELKSVKITPQGKTNTVSGTILQRDAAKDLVTSVPIYGTGHGKEMVFLGRVFADGEESTFRITAPLTIRKIVLDPNETVLTYPKN